MDMLSCRVVCGSNGAACKSGRMLIVKSVLFC